MGLVSVIIPTYNRTFELERALKSVVEQTYNKLEIIIIDDNFDVEISKKIESIIYNFKDSRIKLIKPDQHVNGAYARNIGIKSSKGEYIAFLDDDDEWEKNKIEVQYEFLQNHKNYQAVASNYAIIQDGKEIKKVIQPEILDFHFDIFRRRISLFTPTLFFKREELLETRLFDEKLKRHQDIQLLLDFTKKHKITVIQEVLVRINIDDKSNKPNYSDIEKIKADFFVSVAPHFDMYPRKSRRRIKAAHYFEIMFVMLKNKRILKAIKYFFKIGFSIKAYLDLVEKYRLRKRRK